MKAALVLGTMPRSAADSASFWGEERALTFSVSAAWLSERAAERSSSLPTSKESWAMIVLSVSTIARPASSSVTHSTGNQAEPARSLERTTCRAVREAPFGARLATVVATDIWLIVGLS